MMENVELQHARETYAYIPAKLTRGSEGSDGDIRWPDLQLSANVPPPNWHSDAAKRRGYSSLKLDDFHSVLLGSDNAQALLHGLLSIVFWGYVSGTDGRIHVERALKRARWHLDGKINSPPQRPAEIISHLKNARELLETANVGDALIEVTRIKFLGMAFGSKVLTFMNTRVAAVYDEVISLRLEEHPDVTLNKLAKGEKLTKKLDQANLYAEWCDWCRQKAETLNKSGASWRDWDGTENVWRAVDTERALYALGR
jgi:hypothetical protein